MRSRTTPIELHHFAAATSEVFPGVLASPRNPLAREPPRAMGFPANCIGNPARRLISFSKSPFIIAQC